MSGAIFMKFTDKSNLATISYNQSSIQNQLAYQRAFPLIPPTPVMSQAAPAMSQAAPAMSQAVPAMSQAAPAMSQANTQQIGNIFRNMFSFNTSKKGCGSCGG